VRRSQSQKAEHAAPLFLPIVPSGFLQCLPSSALFSRGGLIAPCPCCAPICALAHLTFTGAPRGAWRFRSAGGYKQRHVYTLPLKPRPVHFDAVVVGQQALQRDARGRLRVRALPPLRAILRR
jgi:hypothetical protein